MNARSRPRPADPFVYSDEQWARMREIVGRAGGDAARNKLDEQRAIFEKIAEGWRDRHKQWNGRTLSAADADAYRRAGRLTRKLAAVLDELSEAVGNDRLPFPAILVGNDLIWESPRETSSTGHALARKGAEETKRNRTRFANFRGALQHVAERAEWVTSLETKKPLLARHTYFADLGRVWRELGLNVTTGTEARFVQFAEAASEGVYPFKDPENARQTIVNSMKNWPRCQEGKKRRRKS